MGENYFLANSYNSQFSILNFQFHARSEASVNKAREMIYFRQKQFFRLKSREAVL